jgi:hypothetical protein
MSGGGPFQEFDYSAGICALSYGDRKLDAVLPARKFQENGLNVFEFQARKK